jgi:cytochrome subunit of sulfide dehydrogenase
MKWTHLNTAVAVMLAAGAVQAQAIDPLQVRSWAGACANCHGTNGVAQAGNESLAGVNKDDLLKKMLDFKTGKKPATIMHQLSKGYTDEQLAALAGYFAAQKK